MPLATGARLGPYEIIAPLGAGGMGEVYRATDTRLARTVAVKVLPPTLAADPQFRERFEREARAVSQLNHPNICTLHDVGQQDGTAFLVMELLDGETLADHIRRGPLPVEQVLDYGLQIADALDKAHRQGIIHRDLKPANVMLVRGSGASLPSTCKLLDFGLAKLGPLTPAGAIETRVLSSPLPAPSAPLTSQGSLLGTFQYMAPEQIEGQDVDARVDIWAFGCMLYEMATGKRPFEGKTQASLIAAILEREPRPMAELQPMTPPALGRVVRTCLAKDPNDRFQTAHDLWLQLQWIEEGGSSAGLPAPVIAHRRHRERAVWLTVTAAVGLAAAAAAWWAKPDSPVSQGVTRFDYVLPDQQRFTRSGRRVMAISPDGTKIVYVANQQLYLRPIDQLEAQPIRGTNQDPLEPVFSPDGEWIAYFAPSKGLTGRLALRKIRAAGGPPVTLAEVAPPHGATWEGHTIVFGQNEPGTDGTISAVSDAGGAVRVLTTVKAADGRPTQPQLIDDGRRVLFNIRPRQDSDTNEGQVVVQAVDGSAPVVLSDNGRHPRRLSSGQLVYFQKGTLFVVPVDWNRLQVTGGAVPVAEGVAGTSFSWAAHFDVSKTGTIVYRPGSSSNSELLPVWVDRTGREQPFVASPRPYQRSRLSPDGTKLATTVGDDDQEVWVWDIAKRTMTRLTFGGGLQTHPIWTPDGRYVVFASRDDKGQTDIFRRPADGTGTIEPLTTNGTGGDPQSFSPDGSLLVFASGGGSDLMMLKSGAKNPTPLLANPNYRERNGMVSPDGRWLAYESTETGTPDIYVRPFPAVDSGRWKISDGGGVRPMWSRSGRELFFTNIADTPRFPMMSITVQPGTSFVSGRPELLFSVEPYRPSIAGTNYDIAPDGRIMILKTAATDVDGRERLVVVSNWIEEVKARTAR